MICIFVHLSAFGFYASAPLFRFDSFHILYIHLNRIFDFLIDDDSFSAAHLTYVTLTGAYSDFS